MYAVIDLNDSQYMVSKDSEIKVDKLSVKDKEITIDKVLLYKDDKNTLIGKPYLTNVKVKAEYIGDVKDKKIIVFKFKRRKNYKKKEGHREEYSIIKIKDIIVN